MGKAADILELNKKINKTFANAYHRHYHIECMWKAPVRLLTRSSTLELCKPVPETNTTSVLKGILAETCIEFQKKADDNVKSKDEMSPLA